MSSPNIFQAIIRNDGMLIQQLVDEDESVLGQRSNHSQDTTLHMATRYGSAYVVSRILKLRPDLVTVQNAQQETPVHVACIRGNLEVLDMLLAVKSPAPHYTNINGEDALFLACKFGNRKLVERLMVHSDINADLSCLQVAISNGRKDMVQLLIETWPGVAKKADENGLNLLHYACKFGQPEIVRVVLEVNPQLALAYDNTGFTPLHLAVISNSKRSLEILIEFNMLAPFAFHPLTGQHDNILHLAVLHNKYDIFLSLIEILGDSNKDLIQSRDKAGNTILHLAVFGKCFELGKYLIMKSTKEQLQTTNDAGITVLDILDGFEDQPDFATQSLRDCLLQKLDLEEYQDHISRADSDSSTGLSLRQLFEEVTQMKKATSSYQSTKISSFSSQSGKDEKEEDDEGHTSRSRQKDRKKDKRRLIEAVEEILEIIKEEKASGEDKQEKRMYKMHMESLQNVRNTINIIAILIATVTFTGCLSPPGGFFQEGFHIGKPVLGHTTAFKVFAISNDIALFLSLGIVVVLVSIIPFRTTPMRKLLALTHKVLWLAVSFLGAAYIAARWATTLQVKKQKWMFGIVLSICGGLLGFTLLSLIIKLINSKVKKVKWRREQNVNAQSFSLVSDIHSEVFVGYYTH